MSHDLRTAITLVELLNLDEGEHMFSVKAFLRLLDSTKRMMAGGATQGEKDAGKRAMERIIARAKAELPKLSPPDRRRVQQALGWDEDQLSTDDADEKSDNPWQLYSEPGWQAVSKKLDVALVKALAAMDEMVATGTDKTTAAEQTYHTFVDVMDSMPGYGAGDTEGRAYLWKRIQRHILNPKPRIA